MLKFVDKSVFVSFTRCDPNDPGPRETQHLGGAGRGDREVCGGPRAR